MDTSTTQAGQEQRATDLSALEATVRRFNEAFNRFDAAAVASFWMDDGTLISPLGTFGEGRAGVEQVFRSDASTLLEGTTSKFTITRARRVAADCTFLDLDHAVENCRMPDGSRGTVKLHVAILARKSGDDWRWVDVRPYRFTERPPALH